MFQDHGAMKVSADVSSPRIVTPGAQSRPSGRKRRPPSSSSVSVSSSFSSVFSSFSSSLSYCLLFSLSLCSGRSPSGSFYLRPPPLPPFRLSSSSSSSFSSPSVSGVSCCGRTPLVVTLGGAGPLVLPAAPSSSRAVHQDGRRAPAGRSYPPQRVHHSGEGWCCVCLLTELIITTDKNTTGPIRRGIHVVVL